MKIQFITIVLLSFFSGRAPGEDKSRPNIVLVLSQTLEREHLGSYGGDSPSPHLDQLAKQGVRYETAWRMPNAELSKKTLLSGRYPCHYSKAPSLPDLLAQSGYQTSGLVNDSQEALGFISQAQDDRPFLLLHIQREPPSNADRFVGQLATLLEDNKLQENTIVIVTGIGGDKTMKKDTGVRVPFIVKAPFLTKQARSSKDLIDFTDLFPTLMDLARVKITDDLKPDGISMIPSIKGSDDPFEKRNWIRSETNEFQMIRDWQHILDSDGQFHDLRSDPLQTKEVSPLDKQAPGRKKRLEMLMGRFP